jgi:molecular chaperone HscB
VAETDHFARLGLARRFDLDPREVERAYLARSRDLHPDYFANASTAERLAAEALSAMLNEAYATLRDPFRRAEYCLMLAGGPSASEQKEMPADFLEEILELRMLIEESREAEPPDQAALSVLEKQLEARRQSLLAEIGDRFALDNGDPSRLAEIRQRLNALKYVQNLLRDLQ